MADLGTYERTRGSLAAYFDGTAHDAWRRLTSDAPVSRIRATVRAGRDEMRRTLLDCLPRDLRGARILDAGCGPGQFSHALAERGASVLGVDISPKLIELAKSRLPEAHASRVTFEAGDMLAYHLGRFDYVVAMDSLIHYEGADIADALGQLAERTAEKIVFTVAPRTLLLSAMFAAGQVFPRSDRAPAIRPIAPKTLQRAAAEVEALKGWTVYTRDRVSRGFYISQAMEAHT